MRTGEPRLRRSARVLLFSPAGELFLIRFVAELQGAPYIFWVTPGGEIDAGEQELAAAQRELFEELGIRPALHGPVHREEGGEYTHLGERVRNRDVFFAACCERDAPRLSGVTADEIRLMQEARWWAVAELAATGELVFPERLAEIAASAWKESSWRAGVLP